jgi:outer membrane beta-barrel protein
MQRWLCGALAALVSVVWPGEAHAQDAGRLVVIQQRKFRLAHELSFAAMFEPADAFSKGLAGEGAYAVHFSDSFAWEVVRAGYLTRFNTDLKDQLLREFGAEPTKFESLQYYGSTSLIWSPYYGKLARDNASITHIELFGIVGAAAGKFTSSYAAGPELGVGMRFFLTRRLSLRFEARDAYFFARKQQNVVFLSAGLSVNLGGTD